MVKAEKYHALLSTHTQLFHYHIFHQSRCSAHYLGWWLTLTAPWWSPSHSLIRVRPNVFIPLQVWPNVMLYSTVKWTLQWFPLSHVIIVTDCYLLSPNLAYTWSFPVSMRFFTFQMSYSGNHEYGFFFVISFKIFIEVTLFSGWQPFFLRGRMAELKFSVWCSCLGAAVVVWNSHRNAYKQWR